MPELKDFKQDRPILTHLKRLTTKDGLLQHADHEVPDPSFGYSIDDNARALIACLWHYNSFQDPSIMRLAEIYFDYIKRVEKEGGSFHNFLGFTEKILDGEGSEDSIARAIWALGEVIKQTDDEQLKQDAVAILKRSSLERHLEHPHVRTKAYILLGLTAAGNMEQAKIWADKLVEIFRNNHISDWPWFEDSLHYANGILPYSLAKYYFESKSQTHLDVARQSFDWLNTVSRINGKPAPIGQAGWYFRNKTKADFDQQPLEAADMVLAATALYEATGKQHYLKTALEWMNWYFGNNVHNLELFVENTGGVYDSLTRENANKNQGAESIVTFLLAYLALNKINNG